MNVTLLPPNIIGDPEVVAMIQAFYSRSNMTIANRLRELGDNLPTIKESLARHYIGYGHDSIGDCGNVAVFFEGVSMLFAKALEDNPLFNGQETSTRFISFAHAKFIHPLEVGTSTVLKDVEHSWLEFYKSRVDKVIFRLRQQFPYIEYPSYTFKVWDTSVQARAFDIMRAFLPAGITTQLSFYGSLRTLREALSMLSNHPLEEISQGSIVALRQLKEQYPFAFKSEKFDYQATKWLKDHALRTFYSDTSLSLLGFVKDLYQSETVVSDDTYMLNSTWSLKELKQLKLRWDLIREKGPVIDGPVYFPRHLLEMLSDRPKGFKVPFHIGQYGRFKMSFMLDFGSFRDIQRHRNSNMSLPILTNEYGIHPWYLQQLNALDPVIYQEAINLINSNWLTINDLGPMSMEELVELQYVQPMGMMVPVEISLALDEMFYIAELRSSKTVHPTLRPIAQFIGRHLQILGFKVYMDEGPDGFVPYRGKQTITRVS